ncbi:unnamed protein product [Zymoseptoria tritici ST99CH_1A5]|nr:unnamed protein product [Zymoseptoria tritici ST99CH_1E4]SMR44810.1 unnamed protein product [Zymoseptoria tritici ST99CH_3D1]SMY19974.1 unnamed protein product [Zymoseptoria tritici ST99CH_1A5]
MLPNASLDGFREKAFNPALPALLPRQFFAELPAIGKWFMRRKIGDAMALNTDYLADYGDTVVPLEITLNDQFVRVEQELSFFLDAAKMDARPALIYLAQASLSDLPPGLTADLPTPSLILEADKGDIYSSSIWLGLAPTYTPLHRDPNPNLFVQLAGKKVVRLFRPNDGSNIFDRVQERIGGRASASMRGEEMMHGREKEVLEDVVWGGRSEGDEECWEAELASGDGLFIPKGWWHSIRGVGSGMTGSVNWWFR